ncbi:MAG: S9 family peptidase, partial [Stenotrophomonas koreensis]
MSKIVSACLAAGMFASGAAMAADNADPYQWLEEVSGEQALDWVKARNAQAEARLATTPAFAQTETAIREVLDSDARIPGVYKMGGYYYNFWKDKNNARGIWRRTTLAEYRKAEPAWETLLDLDALNKAEGENWVWHGANCLRPAYERCLIALSRGGADADVTREFNLATKSWVEDGFYRAEAKGGLAWIDQDNVFVYTDFGDGSMTTSGYPRVVKQWTRGTPMASARVVYEGQADDMYIAAMHDDTPGFARSFVSRTLAFYNNELYLIASDGQLQKIDAPNSAEKSVFRNWLTFELREPWTIAGTQYPAGSLLVTDFNAWMAGQRQVQVLFSPTDTT